MITLQLNIQVKWNSANNKYVCSLLEALGHALRTSSALRSSFAALFIQDAQRSVTKEEQAQHNTTLDSFLDSKVFTLVENAEVTDYSRLMLPDTPTSPYRIELAPHLLPALTEKQHPDLIFLFLVCMVHELAHGYTFYVRTHVRVSLGGSSHTLSACAVGDRNRDNDPTSPVPGGESGYVVEDRWIQGTLKCLVDSSCGWNWDWEAQWDQFKGFQVMDETMNMGKNEKEKFARALDSKEVNRFVSSLLAKKDPGALRLGPLLPHDDKYIRCRSPNSTHSNTNTPRSPNTVLEGTTLVDAVNCRITRHEQNGGRGA
ncbi:uncharacterized protein STEHIDRAFT_172869 [Stereum hirsutum FP-91666 SS1]|uniref:Uncharacterized protein n=1 Tax=Stereum hirsutum (strain FP-91666) TaxID=721885 RepID=R7RZH0_STEHR|nr:uncharacterized protein STEHIDRAFT_172869 [Stereum hirsutum FP-91666 SS1]EIM80228.1 hypothetical protein STEHIDRAFT_172869 [Stereum hirsutum FP-91666 SS1]